jgi:gamma-glutamyltranspeptidase/glutathione hydrolase
VPAGRSGTARDEDISAHAQRTMISSSHPLATEAGLGVLRRGGSAVDAYIATGLVQCVVEPVMTRLAGGFSINVFEPDRGSSRLVKGLAALPAAESGPFDEQARESGRTVVPPGWIAGAHAAWTTWGRVAWAELFEAAISCARDGFVVDQQLWGHMFESRMRAGRFAAGRSVWFPNGTLVGVGEVLVQRELANTLEQLAEQGPSYFFEGEFAKRYVETAREHGGRITLDDMAACLEAASVVIDVPTLPLTDGFELQTTALLYALGLNLAAAGELESRAHPSEDPESLYLLMRLVEEAWGRGLELAGDPLNPDFASEVLGAVTPEAAAPLWTSVVAGDPKPFDSFHLDTNAIVVTDEAGLVAHGTHATSSTPVGVGLMVDGVVVPRPLYYVAESFGGLPAGWGTSLLLLKEGRPQFVVGSPSTSAYQNVLQNTLNVMTWGLEPGESVMRPLFGAPLYPSRRAMVEATVGDAHLELLARRGLDVMPVPPWEPEMGSCHAIRFESDGSLRGCAAPRRFGRVAGD